MEIGYFFSHAAQHRLRFFMYRMRKLSNRIDFRIHMSGIRSGFGSVPNKQSEYALGRK